jgi:tetratricopeptide (TPR) repeat protein
VSGPVIKLRCTSWGQLSAIYERDLRRGVLFIRTTAQLPLGRDTRVDIIMPSGSVVTVEGRVARLVSAADNGPGMELVLTKLPPSVMWMIESALGRAPATTEPDAMDAPLDDGSADAEEQLVNALEGELRSFRSMQPHQILGIHHDAGEAAARAAFAELSKKYHPDRFARFESDLARRVASDVFVVLRDAYRRMADTAHRHPMGPAPTRNPTPARGIPRVDPTPVRGMPRLDLPPGPPPRPPAQQGVSSALPPLAAPLVTFNQPRPPAAPAPAPTPAPAADSPRLSADYLFGDLGPAPAPAQGPVALDEPRLLEADRLLDLGRLDEAHAAYEELVRKNPTHRAARAGRELVAGLKKLAAGDREAAAACFEQALEIEPWSDRAARELGELRRAATERGKGLFAMLRRKGGDR